MYFHLKMCLNADDSIVCDTPFFSVYLQKQKKHFVWYTEKKRFEFNLISLQKNISGRRWFCFVQVLNELKLSEFSTSLFPPACIIHSLSLINY